VVAVPVHGAADVEHQFGDEEKKRGDSVGNVLRGLIVARVEGVDDIVFRAVSSVEVVRADGVGLQSDTEELGLKTVLHVGQFLGEDVVKAVFEYLAVAVFLYGEVFAAVMDPDIHDTGIALCLTHGVGDASATLGMLDPEVADVLVGIGQCQ